MARGDWVTFEKVSLDIGTQFHKWDTQTLKVALIDNTAPPTAGQATPAWGDFSANEVSGGGYTAGGQALSATGAQYSEAAGVATLRADQAVWSQNGTGPTNIFWAIVYNDSDTTRPDAAIGYIDMGGAVSLQDGDVTIAFNSSATDGTLITVTVTA